jgi:hypothetical protein
MSATHNLFLALSCISIIGRLHATGAGHFFAYDERIVPGHAGGCGGLDATVRIL